jgi:CDP-diacylglycerol--serine O-phosphatidyltransferase
LKQHIPNAVTSLNLVFGCLSILQSFEHNLVLAAAFIGAAAVMDFFDGFVARLLGVQGELGKQLDSLADVVSFGVAPGFILFHLGSTCFGPGFCINQYTFLLIPVFSALRLAKFNLDTRQTDRFIGLPTPANAMFMASLPLIVEYNQIGLAEVIQHRYFLTYLPLLSAYLLVAELPLIALKFKHLKWSGNEFRFILILLVMVNLILFKFAGVAISIIVYILLSVIEHYTQKSNTHEI